MLQVKKRDKGFTLVEIIVVLLIIGILLAITIPSIMGYVRKAEDAKLIADMRTLVVEANETATKYFVNGGENAKELSNRITKEYKDKEYGNGFNISGYIGDDSPITFTIFYDDYDGILDGKPQINKLNMSKNNHYISKICIKFEKGSTVKYVVFLKNKDIRVFDEGNVDFENDDSEWYFPFDLGEQ